MDITKPPLEISFDFDDTIAQTAKAVLNIMRRDKEFKYPKIKDLRFDTLTKYDGPMVKMPQKEYKKDILNPCIYRENGNWSHIFPYPDAIKGLIFVSRAITFPSGITIVSKRKRNSDIFAWHAAWFKWYALINYFPLFFIYVGKSDKEKNILLNKLKFDFHVDDKPSVAKHLMNNTRTYPIIFDQPWNREVDSEEYPATAFKRLVPIRAKGWNNLIHILLYLKNKRELWIKLHRIMNVSLVTNWRELQKSGSKSKKQ